MTAAISMAVNVSIILLSLLSVNNLLILFYRFMVERRQCQLDIISCNNMLWNYLKWVIYSDEIHILLVVFEE